MSKFKPKELHGAQFLWGTHHPHCERHSHHLIWIKGHPLCLGCTSLWVGVAIGVVVVWLAFPFHLALEEWIMVHLLLLVPTAIQPFLQKKVFKIFSRTLLGICIASYFITGFFVTSPFKTQLFLLIQIALFTMGYFLLSKWRARKIDNPCVKCPLGHFPVCEWNMPRLLEHPEQKQTFESLPGLQFFSGDRKNILAYKYQKLGVSVRRGDRNQT